MKICIMGAGVIGLTTAWWLAERGHHVTIIERNSKTGQETSFGNGAQLSYSFVAPLASFDTLVKLPSLLLSSAAPIRVRPSLDRDFIRWGVDFLRACNARSVGETTAAQLALAALGRAELSRLTEIQQLQFGLNTAGKLILYRKPGSFKAACKQVDLQKSLGSQQSILSPRECLDFEPALRISEGELMGGTFNRDEQVGDCSRFCTELTARLQARNTVTWLLDTEIQSPIVKNGRLTALKTSNGELEADLFVLSMATEGVKFARQTGFRLPIYPMKGYSITATPRAHLEHLHHSVTDFDQKIVFAPLEHDGSQVIRAAGIADLVGNNPMIDKKRLDTIIRLTRETLDIDTSQDLHPWAGLRPATPDSRPIIGWSPLKGLFLNTGHGALGWTLACGSARLASEMISGDEPSIDPALFALSR